MVVDRSTLDVAVRVGVVGVPHTKEMKILFVRGGQGRVSSKHRPTSVRGGKSFLSLSLSPVYNRYRWILARGFGTFPRVSRGNVKMRGQMLPPPHPSTFSTRPGVETFPLRFSTDRCTPRSFTAYLLRVHVRGARQVSTDYEPNREIRNSRGRRRTENSRALESWYRGIEIGVGFVSKVITGNGKVILLRRERRRCMSLDRNMGRLMQTNRCSGETEAVIAMQKLFRRFHE